jgi:hypothetical protein
MKYTEEEGRQVLIQYKPDSGWGEFREAVKIYGQEVVHHLEEALGLPLDAYPSPVPRWS